MADEVPLVTCYGPGSIAGAIIGTLLITLALVAAGALIYKIYWRSRKGKHLVLVTDVESPDQYAFDNPNFREATPIKQSPSEEKSGKLDNSWLGGWSPLHVFSTPRNDKQRSLDDSYITDSQLKVVSLKSHDFTGLGFSVCGNMRDGIFVKDLLHRGPAFESGCINAGDRIDSVCISFRHMVFEDALTILSYASPYEVQIQVEHNTASRPSTLLRKRDNNPSSSTEPIFHPFYRSQSISDLPMIGKMSGRKSNQHATSTAERNRANKAHGYDSYLNVSDYPTLKLSSSYLDVRKEHQNTERRAIDTVDSTVTDTPKHTKFGIRVLPAGIQPKVKDHYENEQNFSTEHDHAIDKIKGDSETKDVKTILTKGLQNLKEKINSNSLGRKKREEYGEVNTYDASSKTIVTVEQVQLPEEVTRAATAAQTNRKSVSAESLAARKSSADLITSSSGAIDSDTSSEESQQRNRKTKSKGKAPSPPKDSKKEAEVGDVTVDTQPVISQESDIFEPMNEDSDSDGEGAGNEMTCTQATVHHSSTPDEPDSGRKAASLGDLSRLNENTAAPLERAMSLDLDGSSSKKRKAPPPPQDEFCNAFDDGGYKKEPRLEGFNTFQRKLKKSSDFGTLEDALQGSDKEDLAFGRLAKSPEPSLDLRSMAASNIQEFSSWLQEVRKPHADTPADHHLTLNINGTEASISEHKSNSVWDVSSSSDETNISDTLYSSAISTDVAFNSQVTNETMEPSSTSISLPLEASCSTLVAQVQLDQDSSTADRNQVNVIIENENKDPPTTNQNLKCVTIDSKDLYPVVSDNDAEFSFRVNGIKVPEQSRTVLLISQPNSIEQIETVTPEDETPPELPTSPPPNTSLTYITEIRVVTPEPPTPSNSSTPKNIKPQRKDISSESSKIPIRTMKSETGQKVLAAIHSLAAKEMGKSTSDMEEFSTLENKDETTPSVAGFYLKKVPPAVPPRRSESTNAWLENSTKERVNGTPLRFQMPTGVSLPVKTSATKIIFESQEHNEEF